MRGSMSAAGMDKILKNKDGFTLLEVIVAFALLATTVTIILQLFSSNLKVLSTSEDYITAVVKAEAKMREVLDNEELAENVWSETTPDGYTMEMTVSNVLENRTRELPMKLLEVGIKLSWKMGATERSLMLKTMKAVKRRV